MRINEYTCCDEHPLQYISVESLNCTPETNITLHVNWNLFFLMFIYLFLRETEREVLGAYIEEGQKESEIQNLKQAPGCKLSAQSLTRGLNSQTVRSWPEPKSDAQPTEPPRCPTEYVILDLRVVEFKRHIGYRLLKKKKNLYIYIYISMSISISISTSIYLYLYRYRYIDI